MMDNEIVQRVTQQRMERVAEALRANRMDAYCVPTAAQVPALVARLLHKGILQGKSIFCNLFVKILQTELVKFP